MNPVAIAAFKLAKCLDPSTLRVCLDGFFLRLKPPHHQQTEQKCAVTYDAWDSGHQIEETVGYPKLSDSPIISGVVRRVERQKRTSGGVSFLWWSRHRHLPNYLALPSAKARSALSHLGAHGRILPTARQWDTIVSSRLPFLLSTCVH